MRSFSAYQLAKVAQRRASQRPPVGCPLVVHTSSAAMSAASHGSSLIRPRYESSSSRASPQMDAINYGNIPDDLKPKPNPSAKQLNPEKNSIYSGHHEDGEQPKTIGDALQEAASKAGDKPLEVKDARAIQSAEARATGAPSGVMGGPSAYANNLLNNQDGSSTLGDALKDAKDYLPSDKVATQRDAYRVMQAEARNDPRGEVHPHGVAASIQEAVEYNKEKGFIPPDNAGSNIQGAGRGRGAGGAS